MGSEGEDVYSLLSVIGRDCVGALQLFPDGVDPGAMGEVKGEIATEKRVGDLLGDLGHTPLGISMEDEDFRISIAGTQEKTALLFWKKKLAHPTRQHGDDTHPETADRRAS